MCDAQFTGSKSKATPAHFLNEEQRTDLCKHSFREPVKEEETDGSEYAGFLEKCDESVDVRLKDTYKGKLTFVMVSVLLWSGQEDAVITRNE